MERERKRQKKNKSCLSFVLFGSTGDLSRKKLFPAFANLLHRTNLQYEKITIYCLGRRDIKVEALVEKQCVNVKTEYKEKLFASVKYVKNSCRDPDDFRKLEETLPSEGDRIFFLALPPKLFGTVTTMISSYCQTNEPFFTRVILEKPFGYDTESFLKLNRETSAAFPEKSIYRIDHYLGKEVVQNMITLRFMNTVFEPLWNSKHIESVHIQWKEDLTLEGRAGYFDKSGIVRDVMQNHLLQVLALVAMERPREGLQGVVEAKNDVLKCVKTLCSSDVVHGQLKGYRDDPEVPKDSKTSTFCMARILIDNDRWRGTQFLMSAGKGLDERLCEIRIRFRTLMMFEHLKRIALLKLYSDTIVPLLGVHSDLSQNELVIRIQPDPSIYFKIMTKRPGLELKPTSTVLDLTYRDQFSEEFSDQPYELCLLRCVQGDRSVFVGSEELIQAWRIFTPILECTGSNPIELYDFGANAPESAKKLAMRVLGHELLPSWNEFVCSRSRSTKDLKFLFEEFDKDKSGFITAKEFSHVVRSKFYDNRDPPKKLIAKYIRRFDLNGDGKISFEEFLACTRGLCKKDVE